MDNPKITLSPAHCLLLASSLASDADIAGLRTLTSSRKDIFDTEITLRIILSYLPESLEPFHYSSYVRAVGSLTYEAQEEDISIDQTSVAALSEEQARTKLKKLHLLQLAYPSQSINKTNDHLTLFLVHRAHRIDEETGIFPLVAQLIEPFLGYSDWLKDWYTGAILPLLRLDYDYYPEAESSHTLEQFEKLSGSRAISVLLARTGVNSREEASLSEDIGRDFRGIVAPWIYGTQRWKRTGDKAKRRRLEDGPQPSDTSTTLDSRFNDAWTIINQWIVSTAAEDLPFAVRAIQGWGGPRDVDFGQVEDLQLHYQQNSAHAEQLAIGYAQAAFAAIYAAEADTPETIDGAHCILVRLAQLLGFEPPPDLATSIHLLPRIETQSRKLEDTMITFIQPESLLRGDNPLTVPNLETFSLLQMLVYSSYLLAGLDYSLSVVKVAKLRFWSDDSEQLLMVQRILHGLVNGSRRDEKKWNYMRDTLLWLWDWAVHDRSDTPGHGYGIFGKIAAETLESEILQSLCLTGQFHMVTKLYLTASQPPLPSTEVERVIIALAHQHYDEASNGNKSRGGVKKAADLITAFKPHFPHSAAFQRCSALIAATHALSFYSLTLQRGVPFKPVSIRVQEDPIALISHVLEQNPKSYTQLDNLIEIARNLVRAHTLDDTPSPPRNPAQEKTDLQTAGHRVTAMSIEAALSADDFETAYSYVVNRLSPASPSNNAPDDISWRAAYLAGRQRSKPPPPAISSTPHTQTTPQIRRLEQRMDLLSRALLLAPPTSLPEILAAWRRCEEELLAVLAAESAADAAFDEKSDKHVSGLPGSFGELQVVVQPKRKELGRGATEEAPMGLFEVMRGASAAIQRSAAGVQIGRVADVKGVEEDGESFGRDESGRPQRKRDMVASAVSGRLATGIGWMLGATPVKEQG